ncbi:MAG: tRNA-specific adenosine deaminase [Acidobacteria bacterium]|nr:tRNA-specific adenosine deaminase [Acidobacteriota bacterium]NIM61290.1 tRNA-specific adenosine deaminase [Acidobacteriota bacterium]NIQ31599.1 tRNA-specific adenosine deaminase [Acidobacteriota bacterium]NIQ86852.1 tRNA-specific adenosine deaminase [Acidobacteriota bacterium]NIT12184.1 tRNA-specific adenosine deaminase [Acidobacteriota bacterium]
MRLALDLAGRAGTLGEVPVGALVVVDGEVAGRGFNHPIGSCDPTAHAEIAALREASRKLSNYRLGGATLYTTVEPCIMCLGAALHARVGRLVFGAPDPKVGAVAELERLRGSGAMFNHRLDWLGGVLAAESSALLRGFFEQRRTTRAETVS